MPWSKAYARITWINEPSTDTPLNATNLNRMDVALNEVDNRVLQLQGSAYVHIKYSAYAAPTNIQMSDTPNAYMGICVTSSETAPTDSTAYTWNRVRGEKVLLQTADGYIQWKYELSESWTNLVALSTLTGPKGDPGAKGDTGTGLTILGAYADLTALGTAVPSPSVGDAYGIGASAPYNIYIWDGAAWNDHGQLQGPAGEAGAPGPKGDTGPQGSQGDPGPMAAYYGTCSTASGTAAKTSSISGFTAAQRVAGVVVVVKFTNANTSTSATLNVSSTGAASIKVSGAAPVSGQIGAGMDAAFQWDGTYWNHLNPLPVDKLPLAGGTLTGPLTLPGDPSNVLQAAPKQYVDNTVNAIVITSISANTTLAAGHNGQHLLCTNSSAITITVPSGLGAGFNCTVERWGAGTVTIAASSVTLNGTSASLTLGDRYNAAISILAVQSNVFSVKGGLA